MLFPEDLVSEVLKLLPVKSLMRFKCVSPIWLSIITDPSFAKVYCGGSRGLLSHQPSRSHICSKSCFFYLGLDGGSGISKQILLHHIVNHGDRDQSKGSTNIVDGLLCFYRGKDSWLYNIATGEMVQLPSSTDDEATHPWEYCRYNFGFDLVNKRYKLLKTCSGHTEILTIGVDSSWRAINSLSPGKLKDRSACLGGFLCWKEAYELWGFNLAEEKFVTIPKPPDDFGTIFMKLINFGPNIVVTKPVKDEPRVEILRYCHADDGNGAEGIWINAFPELDLDAPLRVVLGILPNGKILTSGSFYRCFGAPIYYLDLAKKDWEMIETEAAMELLREYDFDFACYKFSVKWFYIFNNWSYFEENIISLPRLTCCI